MAVANTIDIQEHKGFIKSCQDFPYVFSKIILKESQGFPEVSQDFPCIIWQVWWKIPKILKSKTREDRRQRTIPISKTYPMLMQKKILQNI